MACNRHLSESTVGVCAACLRERLLALLAASSSSQEPPPSLCSTSSVASAAAASQRSSLLSTLFGRHGHGGRDEHRLRRFTSWVPALSRLFSSSSAAAGTGRGTPLSTRRETTGLDRVTSPRRASDAASPWRPSRMSRETTKRRRIGLGGLALCFDASGRDGKGKGFSGEIQGSLSSQQSQHHHKADARRPEMEELEHTDLR